MANEEEDLHKFLSENKGLQKFLIEKEKLQEFLRNNKSLAFHDGGVVIERTFEEGWRLGFDALLSKLIEEFDLKKI